MKVGTTKKLRALFKMNLMFSREQLAELAGLRGASGLKYITTQIGILQNPQRCGNDGPLFLKRLRFGGKSYWGLSESMSFYQNQGEDDANEERASNARRILERLTNDAT